MRRGRGQARAGRARPGGCGGGPWPSLRLPDRRLGVAAGRRRGGRRRGRRRGRIDGDDDGRSAQPPEIRAPPADGSPGFGRCRFWILAVSSQKEATKASPPKEGLSKPKRSSLAPAPEPDRARTAQRRTARPRMAWTARPHTASRRARLRPASSFRIVSPRKARLEPIPLSFTDRYEAGRGGVPRGHRGTARKRWCRCRRCAGGRSDRPSGARLPSPLPSGRGLG